MNGRSVSVTLVVVLAGCSLLPNDQESYRRSRSLDYLKPPAGVAIPKPDYTYRVPEGTSTQETSKRREAPAAELVAPPSVATRPVEQARPAPIRTRIAEPEVAKAPNHPTVANKVQPQASKPAQAPVVVQRQTLNSTMVPPVRGSGQAPQKTPAKKGRVATTSNQFVVKAPAERVWSRLVNYWMSRGIPLVVSEPSTGRIVTDWVPALDEQARQAGIRDQFEISLERVAGGSKVTLNHQASQMTTVRGRRSSWALIGSDPSLQGVETLRLRDYLAGKGE